jgi:hypothetical protein
VSPYRIYREWGAAAIVLFPAADSPTRRTTVGRLVMLLLVVLVGIVAGRALVVATTNSGRLTPAQLDGLRIAGRYYPIREICPVVDEAALAEGLGDRALRDAGLRTTGNFFRVTDYNREVLMQCGWRNRGSDADPRVSIVLSAVVFADPAAQIPACQPESLAGAPRPVTVGRYRGCRQDGPATATIVVVDDNVRVQCVVETAESRVLDGLVDRTARQCARLLDQLADARPVSFFGRNFWTVT